MNLSLMNKTINSVFGWENMDDIYCAAISVDMKTGNCVSSFNHLIPKKISIKHWGIPTDYGKRELAPGTIYSAKRYFTNTIEPMFRDYCKSTDNYDGYTRWFVLERNTDGAYWAEVS